MDPYSKSILVIHGERDLLVQLAEVLGVHGCRVEQNPSARVAYEQLVAAPLRPRVVVVDWAGVEQEGFPFLQDKAANPRLAPIPVVVLADFLQTRMLPSIGVRAILATPLRPRMVADVVAALCGFTAPLPVTAGTSSYATSVSNGDEIRHTQRATADVEQAGGRVRLPSMRNRDT